MYTVKKVLNNNVLLAVSADQVETVLIGTGIGFHVKAGEPVLHEEKIDQVFVFQDPNNAKLYRDLFKNHIDEGIAALVEKEIIRMEEVLGEMNEKIHITLMDHVNFAIERCRDGIVFSNPFNPDLQSLYQKEYALAKHLVDQINQYEEVFLPEDEVGIIALHIYSALHNRKIEDTRFRQSLIQEIVSSIYREFGYTPQIDQISHQRLLIHVGFAVDRILAGKKIENDLEEYIKEKYRNIYLIMRRIMDQISEENHIMIPDSEVCYLVIYVGHISREQ